jgi:hypothetical protein
VAAYILLACRILKRVFCCAVISVDFLIGFQIV